MRTSAKPRARRRPNGTARNSNRLHRPAWRPQQTGSVTLRERNPGPVSVTEPQISRPWSTPVRAGWSGDGIGKGSSGSLRVRGFSMVRGGCVVPPAGTQASTMRDRSPQAGRDDLRGVLFGLAVLAALGLLDLSLNPATNFATALVMAPVLCAALARPQAVAAVGALAVVGAGLLVAYDAHVGAPGVKVGLVAAGTVLAILISRDRLARAARLARVVSVAEAAQRALLPDLAERVGPAVVAAWYVSATQEALIGGDFYDVTGYQQSARWVIGDVKGKGIEAIRMTAAVLGAFREAAVHVGTLREVAVRIDERVSSLAAEEDFVTALVGELSPDGAVRLINCGHPPPLRLTPGPLVPMTADGTARRSD